MPINWPSNPYQLIEADGELCAGVTLLTSCGHALGHLSLWVQLAGTGSVLLTGDAISRSAELTEGFSGAWDAQRAEASAHKLMHIAQQHDAFVIYEHDPEQWATLKKAPLFYS